MTNALKMNLPDTAVDHFPYSMTMKVPLAKKSWQTYQGLISVMCTILTSTFFSFIFLILSDALFHQIDEY